MEQKKESLAEGVLSSTEYFSKEEDMVNLFVQIAKQIISDNPSL